MVKKWEIVYVSSCLLEHNFSSLMLFIEYLYKGDALLECITLPSMIWAVSRIFICEGRKIPIQAYTWFSPSPISQEEIHLSSLHMVMVVKLCISKSPFHYMLGSLCWRLELPCPSQWLQSFPFSIAWIRLGQGRTIGMDLEFLLTDSFVRPPTSINLGERRKDRFSTKIIDIMPWKHSSTKASSALDCNSPRTSHKVSSHMHSGLPLGVCLFFWAQ